MIIRACDLETTGKDATDEVIEIGAHDVRDGRVYSTPYWTFVKPAAPIPPSSSAVHHITDADVAAAPPWNEAWRVLVDNTGLPEAGVEIVYAAHVAAFERQWLDRLITARWICTWKCALRQWPGMESHKLQALRYALNLQPADPALASPPHRAAPDAYVCGLLLLELLKHQSVETLIAWTAEPAVFTKFDFGEHIGKPLSEARNGYFEWMLTKDFSADWQWNARRELQRRANAKVEEAATARRAYLDKMLAALPRAATVRDLENWYHGETEQLGVQGILVGTDEYDLLIRACADRKTVLLESGQPQFSGAPA
jgi:exodeoxyribonuclease X